MLDNPDLSTEKMFEVMSNGTEIVGYLVIIIVAIIIYLYRYEIGLFIKFAFSDKRANSSFAEFSNLMKTSYDELEKKDFDNKVDKLLNDFSNPEVEIDDYPNTNYQTLLSSKKDIPPPIFRSLKTIKQTNEIIYHFVNEGGTIHGLSIDSQDNVNISFEPQSEISTNGSGFFHIKFDEKINNEILFNLSYYDKTKALHHLKYLYNISENELTIVE